MVNKITKNRNLFESSLLFFYEIVLIIEDHRVKWRSALYKGFIFDLFNFRNI